MARSALPIVSCRLAFEASSRALISAACFSRQSLRSQSQSSRLHADDILYVLDDLRLVFFEWLVQDGC